MSRPSNKRKAQAAASGSSLRPFYLILGAVAIIGIVVLGFQFASGAAPATAPVDVDMDEAELARVEGISIGKADAPVVIYEFADFQCGGCSQFASFVTPLIKERLVEPGLVRYVYYDFPLVSIHRNAFLAARAGRCANDQDQFWGYHDLLYGRQPRWSNDGNAAALFVEYAAEAGLDEGEFESCLRSDRFAEEVTRSLKLGESLGITGTPTIIVNGKRLPGAPTFSELEAMVREEAGMTEQPAAG